MWKIVIDEMKKSTSTSKDVKGLDHQQFGERETEIDVKEYISEK